MPALADAVLRAVVFALGFFVVVRIMLAAIRAFVLTRGSNDPLIRIFFRTTRRLLGLIAGPRRSYAWRDRVLAYYAPVSLVLLPIYWITLVGLGYTLMYWAMGVARPAGQALDLGALPDAFRLSGSSVLTLGFASSTVPGASVAVFSEAALGLILVALLISYLPTIYGAFSRRELLVNLLEVRADSPPSAVVMLTRIQRLHGLEALHEMWERWEPWFSELEETHTSLPVLVFYRSQQADHSWVNAAEAIMDTAALTRSTVDVPLDVQADLTIRAGYLALRRIADYFFIRYDRAPRQDAPTSITRARFDEVCRVLAASGVPLKPDLDRAFLDFNGWRVNYDEPVIALASLTMAPPSWWSRPMVSAYATDEPTLTA
ncbi:MAG: hypothetical protein ACHQZR_07870 [Candidatus Limnocylindrales bacterium]